ncbi:ROK family protein [Sphingomonas sp. BAUL-RG-20F-R05-02]|uniref:ROK family protein n=1 Tax=Sphingomonas sp. BAUL-RG-20F-R05-02 TaxID=2914830 RepID=UPI001F55C4DC|nr:ROK family protein [Sphingomonas sp. BAUL-RG-20F-R05-02]
MSGREPVLLAGVEMGGTKCVCILASGPDEVVSKRVIPTTTPEATLAGIEQVLDEWQQDHGFKALGLACFGPIALHPEAPNYGFITATTKRGWRNTDVAPRLRRRYDVPISIDTDVSGAALAESRWGGARGLSTYAYITVGTGVGAGIIVNGRPVAGLGHAEAGHMRIPRFPGDDWEGSCLYHGDCVEGLASGYAVECRTGETGASLAPDHPVWPMVAHAIAGLCHNLVMGSVPERIFIGGGVVSKQPHLLATIRQMLVESLSGYGEAVLIASKVDEYVVPPALGDEAGPLGAIALALDAAS